MSTDWRVEWNGSRWLVVRDEVSGLLGQLDSVWRNKQEATQRKNWLFAIDHDLHNSMKTNLLWNEDYKLLLEVWDGREQLYFIPCLTPSPN